MTQEELRTYSSGPVAVSAGRGGAGGGEEEEEEAEAHHCSFQTEILFVLHSACAHAQVRAGILASVVDPSTQAQLSFSQALITGHCFFFSFSFSKA
jgi:hypothetical protein